MQITDTNRISLVSFSEYFPLLIRITSVLLRLSLSLLAFIHILVSRRLLTNGWYHGLLCWKSDIKLGNSGVCTVLQLLQVLLCRLKRRLEKICSCQTPQKRSLQQEEKLPILTLWYLSERNEWSYVVLQPTPNRSVELNTAELSLWIHSEWILEITEVARAFEKYRTVERCLCLST